MVAQTQTYKYNNMDNIDRGEADVIERALNAYIEAPNYIIEELLEADYWDGDESYNFLQ